MERGIKNHGKVINTNANEPFLEIKCSTVYNFPILRNLI